MGTLVNMDNNMKDNYTKIVKLQAKSILKLVYSAGLFNDWMYFNLVEKFPFWEHHEEYYKYRFCAVTGKLQECDVHCLGLNPPKYSKTWNTINVKPRFIKVKGKWRIKDD